MPGGIEQEVTEIQQCSAGSQRRPRRCVNDDNQFIERVDQWSLRELHCPVYPQERFRVAAALGIAEQAALGERILLRIQSPDAGCDEFTHKALRAAAVRDADIGPDWKRWRRSDPAVDAR